MSLIKSIKKILFRVVFSIIAIVLFGIVIIWSIIFFEDQRMKKHGNVKWSDPCYKKYYAEKGPIHEIKEDRVCIEFHRGLDSASYAKTLEDADPKTFKELRDNYFIDESSVFYKAQKIIGVNPKDFLVLENGYAKDDGKVFYCGKKIDVDYDTFEIIPNTEYYTKDKNAVYNENNKVDVEDPLTFRYIGNEYFVDKYNVYYGSLQLETLEGSDPETFTIFKNTKYAKDSQKVYYYDKEILGADPETFSFLSNIFAIDKFHVYSQGSILEDLDVNNFDQVGLSDYLRDSNSLYFRDKKVENINVKEFYLVGYLKDRFLSDATSCGTDGSVVVCNGEPISGGKIVDISKTFNAEKKFKLKIPN